MGRKGQSVTISITAEQKESLNQLALTMGCCWGQKPNISALMAAIADRKLIVAKPNLPSDVNELEFTRALTDIERSLSYLLTLTET